MRNIILTLHILGAVMWIGPGLYAGLTYPRHAARRTLGAVTAVDEKLGSALIGSGIALVLVSGIALVLTSDVFGFGHVFVLIGIGAVLVSSIAEGMFFSRSVKRTVEAESEGGSKMDPVFRWTLLHIPLFLFTIWAMVAKLGV